MRKLATVALVVCGVSLFWGPPAQAHRDGCHRWHSCPSDSGSYVCGDLGYYSECPDQKEEKPEAPPPPPPPKAPAAPVSVSASKSAGSIVITWASGSDNGSTITRYYIHRGTSSASLQPLTQVEGLSYADTAVVAGTTYYYQVYAENAGGRGPASEVITVAIEPSPSPTPTIEREPSESTAPVNTTNNSDSGGGTGLVVLGLLGGGAYFVVKKLRAAKGEVT